jgi:hypothetical protein
VEKQETGEAGTHPHQQEQAVKQTGLEAFVAGKGRFGQKTHGISCREQTDATIAAWLNTVSIGRFMTSFAAMGHSPFARCNFGGKVGRQMWRAYRLRASQTNANEGMVVIVMFQSRGSSMKDSVKLLSLKGSENTLVSVGEDRRGKGIAR